MEKDKDIDDIIYTDEPDTSETIRLKDETETIVDSGILSALKKDPLVRKRCAGFVEKAIGLLSAVFQEDYSIQRTISISSDKQRYVLKAVKRDAAQTECAIKALVMPSFYSPLEQAFRKQQFEAETDLTDGLHKILHGKGIVKVIECGRKYPAQCSALHSELKQGVLPIVIPYLITEYAKGGAVDDLNASTDIKSKIKIFKEIAETLSFVHECYHLVHRDIKPSNLLLAKNEAVPKIIDWGAATVMGQRNRDYEIGSMFYFSPNHARGMIAIKEGKEPSAHDYRSDLYPLGLSLGAAVFNEHAENPVEVMSDYFGDNVDDYCEFIASDPPIRFPQSGISQLDDILHRTVSNKDDRFSSMGEFAEELNDLECKL